MSEFAVPWIVFAVCEFVLPSIIFAIVVISYVIQILSKLQQQPGKPGQPKGDLADEIGDFLRQASGQQHRKAQKQPQQEPTSDDSLVELEPLDSGSGHLRESLAEKRPPRFDSHLGEKIEASESQLETHLKESFDHQVGNLEDLSGDSAKPTEAVEASSPEDRVSDTPALAEGLAGVFSEPESIRQAIILREILQRPEHRWE